MQPSHLLFSPTHEFITIDTVLHNAEEVDGRWMVQTQDSAFVITCVQLNTNYFDPVSLSTMMTVELES